MRRFVLVLAMVYYLCSPAAMAFQQEEETGRQAFGPLQKSLLIPGWGQLSERKYLKGALFISAELVCLYKILENNHKGNNNYASYREAESVQDAVLYRDLTEKYDRRRNLFIVGAVGFWAVNLIDIYFIVHKKESHREPLSLSFIAGRGSGMRAVLTYRF